MSEVLDFIKVFNSPSNETLFTNCACYWFAHILVNRFPNSTIMYNPHQIHFAAKIRGSLYDISGRIEDDEDYLDWSEYMDTSDDADMIIENCIKLRGGDDV